MYVASQERQFLEEDRRQAMIDEDSAIRGPDLLSKSVSEMS